jgi:hypothetical protein
LTVRRSRRRWRPLAGIVAYAGICVVVGSLTWVAVSGVAAGGPAATPKSIIVTPSPIAAESPSQSTAPTPTVLPAPTLLPTPEITPSPTPPPPYQMDIYKDGTFVSQITSHACMAGAVANMLNLIGPTIDKTTATQNTISHEITANTTKTDSLNGGYGPEAWAITLTAHGAGHYKLIIKDSMDAALHDAAAALRKTRRPVGLLSWWGAHSWVMTGFQSDHDPRYYTNYTVLGAYIVDPYYPRHSSIWGQTFPPDSFRDIPAMVHNYPYWKRPEGHYPGRDGKWLLVVPY